MSTKRSGAGQIRRKPRKPAARESMLQEVMRLSMPPYSMSAARIAEHLGVSVRTVMRYRAIGRDPRKGVPDPKGLDELGEAAAYVAPLHRWLECKRLYPDALQALRDEREADGVLGEQVTALAEALEAATDAFAAFYRRFQGRYELPHHAREWVRAVLLYDRLLLNVPPRHAKTTIISVWYPVWRIAADRNIQILIISQTEKLAKDKICGPIAWQLEFNQELIKTFGRFKPWDDSAPWRPLSGELLVEGRTRQVESGDFTLQARGKGQQLLGLEADIIIGDDVVGRADAWSAAEREKTSEYWHGDVMSRRSPEGSVAVVGQCLHHEDLYAELAAKRYTAGPRTGQPVWKNIRYPAVLDWERELVLWPEVWPFARLMEVYEDLKRGGDSWLWEAMYQQNPLPASARLVRPEWIRGDPPYVGCLDHQRRLGERPSEATVGEERTKWVTVISVDPSPERMTGIIVADVYYDEQFRCDIIDLVRARLDVRGILDVLERYAAQYKPQYLIWEHNAFARWFLQDPRFQGWDRRYGVHVIPHTTGRNKSDPQYGMQSLASAFEFGRVRLPAGDGRSLEAIQPLIEEATTYVPEAPKAATYTDLLMALWFIYFNHQRLIPNEYTGTANAFDRWRSAPPRLDAGWRFAKLQEVR